jgi:hypothetical protein
LYVSGIVGVGGIAAAAWFLGPWRDKTVVPPPTPPTARAESTATPAPVVAIPSPDTTQPTAVRPSRPSDRPSREDLRPALTDLRANARTARERAVTAGATPAELAAGDEERRTAEQLATQRRFADAISHLSAAIGLWGGAEQTARTRAQQAAAQPPPVTQPPVVTAPPPTAPSPAPENPRPLIEAAIQGYARALESRDVQQVRRAYPGLTAQQAQVWRDFFGMVSALKVDLAIKQLQISGDVAEAEVEGTNQYVQSRRPQRQPIAFHATLERSSGSWRITSIQ